MANLVQSAHGVAAVALGIGSGVVIGAQAHTFGLAGIATAVAAEASALGMSIILNAGTMVADKGMGAVELGARVVSLGAATVAGVLGAQAFGRGRSDHSDSIIVGMGLGAVVGGFVSGHEVSRVAAIPITALIGGGAAFFMSLIRG